MLSQLLNNAKDLDINELRNINETLLEFVIYFKDLNRWENIFTDFINGNIKPQGIKPNKEHLSLTNPYGGIRKNQILYYNNSTIIMVWPWENGTLATVKAIKEK